VKLSVVILNYNVRHFLELCLRSVKAAIKDIDAEIIVVDNNSLDDSCSMVKLLFPEVNLIENKDNCGFSKGNNIGVKVAKGEYLCILNPDTVVAEDTFVKALQFAESKSNLGIVGCQLLDGIGEFLPESKRHLPTVKVAFLKLLGYSKFYYTNTLKPNDIGKTDILVGAFMLLKQSVYNEVNGFDEDYFMYGEDVDLSYKILKAGYSNYYFGKTSILHFKGESTLKDKTYAKRFYGAMEIFYKKHFGRNPIALTLMKFVLKIASKKGNTNKEKGIEIDKSFIVSESLNEQLKTKIKQPMTLVSSLEEEMPNNAQIVLDIGYLSYKSIIEYMKSNALSKQNSYRLYVSPSNFMLGSDSSVSRGEVVHF
jgi:GT2 family glycosyltransferase